MRSSKEKGDTVEISERMLSAGACFAALQMQMGCRSKAGMVPLLESSLKTECAKEIWAVK